MCAICARPASACHWVTNVSSGLWHSMPPYTSCSPQRELEKADGEATVEALCALLADNCRLCVCVHTCTQLMHRLNYKTVWNCKKKKRDFPSTQMNTADGRVLTNYWFAVFSNNRHQKPFLCVSSGRSQWQPDAAWPEKALLLSLLCRGAVFHFLFSEGKRGSFAAATRMHIWAERWWDGGGGGQRAHGPLSHTS